MLVSGCGRGSTEAQTATENTRRPANEAHAEIAIDLEEGQILVKHNGAAHIDPASGKISWPAVACTLEDCSGRGPNGEPLLFLSTIDGATIEANGEIAWPDTSRARSWVQCPACGRSDGVGRYDPPAVAHRRSQLAEELTLSRAAHKEARRERKPAPTDHRTPQEILDEIANLPRVFLVPEDSC